jgi:hypothetical protein
MTSKMPHVFIQFSGLQSCFYFMVHEVFYLHRYMSQKWQQIRNLWKLLIKIYISNLQNMYIYIKHYNVISYFRNMTFYSWSNDINSDFIRIVVGHLAKFLFRDWCNSVSRNRMHQLLAASLWSIVNKIILLEYVLT